MPITVIPNPRDTPAPGPCFSLNGQKVAESAPSSFPFHCWMRNTRLCKTVISVKSPKIVGYASVFCVFCEFRLSGSESGHRSWQEVVPNSETGSPQHDGLPPVYGPSPPNNLTFLTFSGRTKPRPTVKRVMEERRAVGPGACLSDIKVENNGARTVRQQ